LEELGFHSHLARQLPAQLRAMHGDWPPRDPGRAAAQLGEYLAAQWRRPAPLPGQCGLTHVLIGPSGSGKSTCLGKWLSQLVLAHSQPVKACRLDGLTVNTADSLTVVGEALGVTVERTWNDATPDAPNTWRLIDLPGVDWRDSQAVADLERVLNGLGRPQIHLVLNAAYEAGILFDQIHAFSGLPVTDLIFTHMDEEPRHAKLWNFLLGTKHSIGYLSAGQNIPGNFHRASAERLLPVGFA
jgi:flagellar biosynthesis GTPase FlhF